jgi:hypothetical protein
MDSRVSHLCTKLPAELPDGKTGHIFFPVDFFNVLENSEIVQFHRNRLITWVRIHFFRILITTSVNKKVSVKITKLARKKLWNLSNKSEQLA